MSSGTERGQILPRRVLGKQRYKRFCLYSGVSLYSSSSSHMCITEPIRVVRTQVGHVEIHKRARTYLKTMKSGETLLPLSPNN